MGHVLQLEQHLSALFGCNPPYYAAVHFMAARNTLDNAEEHNTLEWLLYLIFAAFWQYYILVLWALLDARTNIWFGCAEPEPVSAPKGATLCLWCYCELAPIIG